MIIKNKYCSQIEIFKLWLEENRDNFICKPLISEDSDSYLALQYENIIDNIVVRVDNNSSINIRVENLIGLEYVDLLADFLVVLMTNESGKYYNESLPEQNRVYYDIPEPIYYDEYNLFLKWSNKTITKDKYLYVQNIYNDRSSAKVLTSNEIETVNEEDSDKSISKLLLLAK